MARATTRTQKPSVNIQSQGRPSQTQRTRRTRNESDTDDDNRDLEGDEEDGELAAGRSDAEQLRKANDLVRLALFYEQKRLPLRREEISKKILGQNSRAFNLIFGLAQDTLRKVFGLELAELQTRASLEAEAGGEDRNATGIRKKATVTGSKTYILRSVLHPALIEHAALTDEKILEEEAAEVPFDDDDDEDDSYTHYYGSLISWSSADQLNALGIMHTILALILVSGRVITDGELRAHLKRLGLTQTASITLNAQATVPTQSVEVYLSMLLRQGYLDRVQVGDAKIGGKKGGKRARMTQADEENGATYEWRWGSRAQAEVGEKAIAQFIAEFMVGEPDEDDDDAGRPRQDVGSKLERMAQGIERAAGGQLSDIR